MYFLQRVVSSIILLSNIIDDVVYFLTHPTISICVENVLNFSSIAISIEVNNNYTSHILWSRIYY